MKRYKVTGLNKRSRPEYRCYFETIEEAEHWYNQIMNRQAITFVTLMDMQEEKAIKMQGCSK